jgi:DNA (cytosine-5)-methyltransferase 1
LNYADTFCGMGGFSQAMEGRGECVWACDIDADAAKTFDTNFKYSGSQGDICKKTTQSALAKIPDFDIIFGGFPCQAFSINGTGFRKAAGIASSTVDKEDKRHDLYKALVRLLKAKRPRYFLFENVGGLTRINDTDNKPMLDKVLKAFRECGYNVAYKILDAADFGVPQQRKRVYFVGIRTDLNRTFDFTKVKRVPRTLAIKDILQTNVDEGYLLENYWKTYLCNAYRDFKGKSSGIKPNGWEILGKGDLPRFQVMQFLYDKGLKPTEITRKVHPVCLIYGDTPSGISRQGDRVYSKEGLCPTLATFTVSIPKVDSDQGLRRLTPRECARLQGFPDSYQLPSNETKAYRQIGNAVCVKVVQAILNELLDQTQGGNMGKSLPAEKVQIVNQGIADNLPTKEIAKQAGVSIAHVAKAKRAKRLNDQPDPAIDPLEIEARKLCDQKPDLVEWIRVHVKGPRQFQIS